MAYADHISVSRGFYRHHGIDCGDGTVIHFDGDVFGRSAGSVLRSPVRVFASGGRVAVERHDRCADPDVVIRRAHSSLGLEGFHILRNNCEHFATWCKTGRASSAQVRNFGVILTSCACAIAAMIAAETARRRSSCSMAFAKELF